MRNKGVNRVKWVHLRLSPAEYKILIKRRSDSTCRSLSQYLRDVLFERPLIATYRNLSQDNMIQELARLNQELNAIGNNLNQVTKKFHTLQHGEEAFWGRQFLDQAENVIVKIAEVKESLHTIALRWLR